jgi:purine-binding chemotaxis protein CheW
MHSAGLDETTGSSVALKCPKFVAFEIASQVFALEMVAVEAIIRLPAFTQVPMAPAVLHGIATMRGGMLPIISLRHVMGIEESPFTEASRVLVLEPSEPVGFVVDRTLGVIEIEPGRIEAPKGVFEQPGNAALVSAVARDVGGHPLIMLLALHSWIAERLRAIPHAGRGCVDLAERGGVRQHEAARPSRAHAKLLSFEVCDQEYAIAVEHVQEIVKVPENVARMPHASAPMLGLAVLRTGLLPLASSRAMLGLPSGRSTQHDRIVVIRVGGSQIGILVDRVREVLPAAPEEFEAMPRLLTPPADAAQIEQICRPGSGARLIQVLSAAHLMALFGQPEPARAGTVDVEASDVVSEEPSQLLVCRLGSVELALHLEAVQEIIAWPAKMTHVPCNPQGIEGLINLRGTVLPLIALRQRLHLGEDGRADPRIVVVMIGQTRIGLIVDRTMEMLRVPCGTIGTAPTMSGGDAPGLFRIVNLHEQQRMLHLVDPALLLPERVLNDCPAAAASA